MNENIYTDTDTDIINAANNLWYLRYNDNKKCQLCVTSTTPLWRKYKNYHMLCNKCGIKCKNRNKK